MSLVLAAPELLTAAADLESIESALRAAHRAAASPTTGLAAAAADEVSQTVAALFAECGQQYQALSAQAGAFHEQFVQALVSGADSYLTAEVAAASLLGPQLIGAGGTGLAGAAINPVSSFLSRELGIYDFRDWRGWLAFVLDYTWGWPGTVLGYGLQLVNESMPDAGYDTVLSRQAGAHVYRRGVGLSGFATTLGNTTTRLGYSAGVENAMTQHEAMHVWQSRIFGPLYQASYAGWMAGGLFVGTGYWLLHQDQSWYRLVEAAAYVDNPWEVMAYGNQGKWPPSIANPALLWPSWAYPVVLWPGWAKLFTPFM